MFPSAVLHSTITIRTYSNYFTSLKSRDTWAKPSLDQLIPRQLTFRLTNNNKCLLFKATEFWSSFLYNSKSIQCSKCSFIRHTKHMNKQIGQSPTTKAPCTLSYCLLLPVKVKRDFSYFSSLDHAAGRTCSLPVSSQYSPSKTDHLHCILICSFK